MSIKIFVSVDPKQQNFFLGIQSSTNNDALAIKIAKVFQKQLSVYVPGYEHNIKYRSGKWDGKEKFYTLSTVQEQEKGTTFRVFPINVNFLERVFKILQLLQKKVKYKFEFSGEIPKSENKDDAQKYIKSLNFDFEMYNHQKELIFGALTKKNHFGISSTGSGKSVVIYGIVKYYYKRKKILILVPSIDLVSQLHDDIKEYDKCNGNKISKISKIGGEDSDNFYNDLTISTWQSAYKHDLSYFDVVIVDEAHKAKAPILNVNLKKYNFDKVIGLTGTLPQLDYDRTKLEEIFGYPKRYITAKEMINLGLSTDVQVIVMFLLHEYHKLVDYHTEISMIKSSKKRKRFVKEFLLKLKNKGGVNIALFNHTAHGMDTYKSIGGPIKKFSSMKKAGIFYIDGKTKSSDRQKIREYLRTDEAYKRGCILIAQYGVLSTGVNIKTLKNLIFLAPTKSYITIIQSIGRVLRKHKLKKKAYVFDLVDDFCNGCGRETPNYALKHFFERLGYYEEEQFDISEIEIDLSNY